MNLVEDVVLARRLAIVAADIALSFFQREMRHELKADRSPVTEADLAVERELLGLLAQERPDDDVLSEEAGWLARGGRRRWLIDPIDGTTWFLAGEDDWGTHVALEVDGNLIVGVITRPVAGRSWWAASDLGAWTSDGRQLEVSATSAIEQARVGGYMQPASAWEATVRDQATWVRTRSPIVELIEGRLDAVLSEGGFEWDHAPAVVLVREAGGRFIDRLGGDRIDLRGGLYANAHLHRDLCRGMHL